MNITSDERPISSLVIDYGQRAHDWNVIVGNNGVSKIVAYDEAVAEMVCVPWFAVYVGDAIVWRVNSKYVVEVSYAK